ncbi:acyltransferase [Citricoccus sp. GCM10030269]|uniref:acyltransferase n=1 Tax=Citricoccus sp. GCM10030269 TaxID=3273388 RepID=UPI0036079DB9
MSVENSAFIAASADVADDARIQDGAKVWHLAQVREGVEIGKRTVVGRGAYIGTGVRVGADSKIQNYALVYEPAVVEGGVFVGPAAVLTNDTYPRAIAPDGSQKSADDWDAVGVTLKRGASVGARAVCVAPVTVGQWAMVAAGSVVVKDVPDYALVAGVPARQLGWVGPAGRKLQADGHQWVCPETGQRFVERNGHLEMGERHGL